MEVGDLHKVWEIRALKRKPDEPSARALLDRIAKQVQPIMRRRKWRVKVLSEFSPKNPRLLGLNVNAGVEVKLRLRRAGRDHDFIPYEEVLDTMLHELCHIVRGPHDAQFYKLWDELRKECEELVSKGITGAGQGFDGTGRRLGGFTIHPPPPSLRQATLGAAQKRARNGALLPSGPRKLGGNNDIMSVLTPIQAAAMAAERRMHDDLWCGSHDQSGIDDSEDVVILEQPPKLATKDGKNTKCSFSSGSAESSNSSGSQTAPRGDSSSCRTTTDAGMTSLWACNACTLLNQDYTFGQAPAAMSINCLTSSSCLCYHFMSGLSSCRKITIGCLVFTIQVTLLSRVFCMPISVAPNSFLGALNHAHAPYQPRGPGLW